jgi:microcystin-dependent protein
MKILLAGILAFAFSVLIPLPAPAAETVPKLINYQGKLTDAAGENLRAGQYTLRFKLFDAAAAGTLVWGEEREVTVVKGVFNVILGGAGALPVAGAAVNSLGFAFGGAERYLETTILAGPDVLAEQVLAPRQQLMSVPFALRALHGVPTGTVVSFAGGTSPEGWVFCDARTLDASDEKYRALAGALGTAFNTGAEPAGHFRVPDMRGRTAIGSGKGDTWNGVGGATDWSLGSKFGAEKHQMTVGEMPPHSHGIDMDVTTSEGGGYGLGFSQAFQNRVLVTRWWNNPTQITRQAGGVNGVAQPHNNMQPSLVLNYLIKL